MTQPSSAVNVTRDDFHTIRRKGIGGSDIPVVMGLSPYTTPYQLWLAKTGRVIPQDISHLPHVKRGIDNEPVARSLLEAKYGMKFEPMFWNHPKFEWMRCSCDGSNLENKIMCEIKVVGKDKHEDTARGQVPDIYFAQCQWNMYIADMEKCLYTSYCPEDGTLHVVEVLPDVEFLNKAIEAATKFWTENVLLDTPPPLSSRDWVEVKNDKELEDLITQWSTLKTQMELLEAELEAQASKIKDWVKEKPAVRAYGITVQQQARKGNVNYKLIPELRNVNLEDYRAPTQLVTVIKRIDKKEKINLLD